MGWQDNFDLTGEIVVLTGGAGILGSRFARALASRGARVALVDLDPQKLDKTVHSLVQSFPNAIRGYTADITDGHIVSILQKQIRMDLGEVTALVNNAAAKSANFFAPFEQYPLEDWESVMRVNLTGAMLCSQVFGSEMAKRGCGCIVNILSIYGIVAPDQRIYEDSLYEGRPINTPAVYSTSKAALWGLTKYLATYWADKGVRVNAITPGGVFSGQNEAFVKRYSERVPMGRMAEGDEMCGALIFLVSRASSYVTGHNLVVDGGLTVW